MDLRKVSELKETASELGVLSIHYDSASPSLDDYEAVLNRVRQTKSALTPELLDAAKSAGPNQRVQLG